MATQPTTLSERVHTLNLVPLVKSDNPVFTDWYTFGLGSRLFGQRTGDGPSDDDGFLLSAFGQCRKLGYFERAHEHDLSRTIGLALGMMLGGVLLPDGTVRSDITTLVTLISRDTIRGYRAGRDFFFLDADEEEDWYMSDDRLFEWLRDLAEEYTQYDCPVRTIHFAIGTILGELSGHLFSWTAEEQHAFEARSTNTLGYVCNINPKSLVAQQYSLQAVS